VVKAWSESYRDEKEREDTKLGAKVVTWDGEDRSCAEDKAKVSELLSPVLINEAVEDKTWNRSLS
jgi:hypothetical protein